MRDRKRLKIPNKRISTGLEDKETETAGEYKDESDLGILQGLADTSVATKPVDELGLVQDDGIHSSWR